MRIRMAITFALVSVFGIGPANARDVASEIHTTFQPLLWNGHQNKVQISAEGAISITEGQFDLPTLLGDNALRALEAAAKRLHQRYGGRRAITVERFGDNLDVRVGPSTHSKRQGSHFFSVFGTGGGLRHISHKLKGPPGIERSHNRNYITGAHDRRLVADDGRAWIKLTGSTGAFGITFTRPNGKSGGQIEVPAPGSAKPAIRTRPDGQQVTMPAQKARQRYQWMRHRPSPRPR